MGLGRKLWEWGGDGSTGGCFGFVSGVPGRQLAQRGQLLPLGEPDEQQPGHPELRHRLPPGPQSSPLNQAGARGRAERRAMGGGRAGEEGRRPGQAGARRGAGAGGGEQGVSGERKDGGGGVGRRVGGGVTGSNFFNEYHWCKKLDFGRPWRRAGDERGRGWPRRRSAGRGRPRKCAVRSVRAWAWGLPGGFSRRLLPVATRAAT